MKRRTMIATTAAVAAVAGGGTALWLRRNSGTVNEEAFPGDVWNQSFESLSGAPAAMSSYRGKPLLLNFWATWCAPCVTEMPLLDAFARSHATAGWHVLALAIDNREAVQRFIDQRRLTVPVALASTIGIDLSRSLGNTVGALPFTAGFASDGRKAAVRLGALEPALLDLWVQTIT